MKKTLITILKVAILLAIVIWIAIVFLEFLNVKKGENPKFAVAKTVKTYEDGSNTIYYGLGYKVIKYNRACQATEFGPIFITERENPCKK